MKQKCRVFQLVVWFLLSALVILGAQVIETTVVEAAGSILTSKDGLWEYEIKEDAGETVVAVDGYNGTD